MVGSDLVNAAGLVASFYARMHIGYHVQIKHASRVEHVGPRRDPGPGQWGQLRGQWADVGKVFVVV